MYGNRIPPRYALTALVLALAACRGDAPAGAGGQDARPDREWTDAARVEAIAATLQACSYEGQPTKVVPDQLRGSAPGDCKAMVEQIMGYTGLPANFVVTAGPVANALAVILLDNQKVPQRVIAFNPDFIGATQRATGGDSWAPVSIMAHEIGHHLSGHTITAGGSRPAIELEADKFSGYVLQKMGAPLADATKAILAFGTDHDMPTHPGKARRAAAITQGWQEACRQQAGADCTTGAMPATTGKPPARTAAVTLPAPSATAIPFKYGRFVVDETGKLDPDKLRDFDARLYQLAKTNGIELAVLFVNDLHGMSADDYAWAMMRQLRIGKLDLGNGGVFVIAPNQGTSGVAFAPGVAKALEFSNFKKLFDIWLGNRGWERGCVAPQEPDDCSQFTGHLLNVFESPLRMLNTTFKIQFNSIEDAIANSKAFEEKRRAARKAGKTVKMDDDAFWAKSGWLVRFSGTVTDVAPKPGPAQPQTADDLRVNPRIVADGKWRAVLVKTADGQETTLYMQPRTEGLMPAGALQAGKQYTFVGELKSAGRFATDQGYIQLNPSVWLFSYEAL